VFFYPQVDLNADGVLDRSEFSSFINNPLDARLNRDETPPPSSSQRGSAVSSEIGTGAQRSDGHNYRGESTGFQQVSYQGDDRTEFTEIMARLGGVAARLGGSTPETRNDDNSVREAYLGSPVSRASTTLSLKKRMGGLVSPEREEEDVVRLLRKFELGEDGVREQQRKRRELMWDDDRMMDNNQQQRPSQSRARSRSSSPSKHIHASISMNKMDNNSFTITPPSKIEVNRLLAEVDQLMNEEPDPDPDPNPNPNWRWISL